MNAVSSSLIKAPDFKDRNDVTRKALQRGADAVAFFDGEFVLKVRKGISECDCSILNKWI